MNDMNLEEYLKQLLELPDDKLNLEIENIKVALKKFMNENDLNTEEMKNLNIVLEELEKSSS